MTSPETRAAIEAILAGASEGIAPCIEALEWALAEIDGRTRYINEGQRDNCRQLAEDALEDVKRSAAPESSPDALSPCPFGCGSTHLNSGWSNCDGERGFSVHCNHCGMIGPWDVVREKATAAWNRRTPSPATIDALVALVEGAVAGERERCARSIDAIAKEAAMANDVIRINRDGDGQGRIKVATAMHRIARIATAIRGDRT